MSRISVPISIRRLRHKSKPQIDEATAFEYLWRNLKKHVVSEKYIFDKNILVLDMKTGNKHMIKMAIEKIFDRKIVKITSLVRKPEIKHFRGRTGHTSKYVRFYVRTNEPVDLNLLNTPEGIK